VELVVVFANSSGLQTFVAYFGLDGQLVALAVFCLFLHKTFGQTNEFHKDYELKYLDYKSVKLFIYTLAPALVIALLPHPPEMNLCYHTLVLPPDRKWILDCGSLCLEWSPLGPTISHGTCIALFIRCSRLFSLTEPGLGASLSSYLKGVLY